MKQSFSLRTKEWKIASVQNSLLKLKNPVLKYSLPSSIQEICDFKSSAYLITASIFSIPVGINESSVLVFKSIEYCLKSSLFF